MTLQTTRILATCAIPLTALGLSIIILTLVISPEQLPGIDRYHEKLRRDLRTMMMPAVATETIRGQILLIMAAVVGAFVVTPFSMFLIPAIALFPSYWLTTKCRKRADALETQLDGFLVALTNAIRAAPALGSALASVVPLCPRPTRDEIDWVVKAFQVGTPLDQALMQLSERVPSQSLAAAVNMLCIARRTGGDLAKTLETSAASLREMARLEGVVRTKTASGKAQATAIGFLPIPLVAGLRMADENFLAPLLANFTGHLIITASIALWIVAIVLANWIVAVDI